MQYQILSKYYQNLILDKDYDVWTDYLLNEVKKQLPFGVGYDVGSGTGIFTRKLKKAGYKVTGVDISADMLAVAKELSVKENLNIDYILADMRSLKSLEKLDFITAVNDGLNYVKQSDVKKVFTSFNKCLKKRGILMFDVSTQYKLCKILNGNMFGDDGEDLSYIWLNDYDDIEKKLNLSLSFFEKQGDVYKRYDEVQVEYAHDILDIKTALENAGFTILKITDAFGKELTKTSTRAVFLAVKN